jgi:hypothetical protein
MHLIISGLMAAVGATLGRAALDASRRRSRDLHHQNEKLRMEMATAREAVELAEAKRRSAVDNVRMTQVEGKALHEALLAEVDKARTEIPARLYLVGVGRADLVKDMGHWCCERREVDVSKHLRLFEAVQAATLKGEENPHKTISVWEWTPSQGCTASRTFEVLPTVKLVQPSEA